MIRLISYALLPLIWLLLLASLACVLGYGLLQLAGDVLPLAKTITKTTQILLLLGIFPLKKWLQLSWSDLGFAPSGVFFKQLGQGLVLSFLTLLPVLLTLIMLDVHVWDDSRVWTVGKLTQKMGLVLLLSLLIGISEETLYRGLLLTSLQRKIGGMAAIILGSLYFAALHFLKTKATIGYADMHIGSGFQLMAKAFGNWLNPEISGAFIALFVVGFFLALLRSRAPRSLGLCIGCHAGWVWQIMLSKSLFNVNPQADYLYLVNTYYDGVVGPLVSVWLVIALAVGWWIERARLASR